MVKGCHNCEHHTWGNEWWNCKTECIKCKYTDMQGEKVPSNWKPLPMTNADRIRAMSDEELSVFLWEFDREEVARKTEYALERRKITEWLKRPAEGE